MATVKIDGVEYSMDDPCSIALALRKVRLMVVTGDSAQTVRFGQDETSFFKSNLAALDQEIRAYTQQCETATGSGKRVRYAKPMRYV